MLTRGVPYIATKASDDGTLEVGDRIRMSGDDDKRYLVCENVGGWIDYDELPAAMKGMHCKADARLIAKHNTSLKPKPVSPSSANTPMNSMSFDCGFTEANQRPCRRSTTPKVWRLAFVFDEPL